MGAPETRFLGGGHKPRNPRPDLGAPFWSAKSQERREQIHKTNILKNEHPKTRTLMPSGCQKGDKVDAQTHAKTIPKSVSKQSMNIMKIHLILICKIIQQHCKNKCFWRVSRLRAQTEKVSKNTSTMIPTSFPKSINNRCENDARTSDANIMENKR